MIDWLRHLFVNGHVPADAALKDRANETAKKSEEALKESQRARAALEQIRRVEETAKDHH